MADQPAYESPLDWRTERSETLVVACADGRWRPHIEDFVANHLNAGDRIDFLSVPGGIEPLTLVDLVPKDFNFVRRRLELLVRTHKIRRIVAIAHEHCGWYRERRIGPLTIDLRARQIAHLQQARVRLQELFPDVAVDTYYARLDGAPPRVVFDVV
jgi:hypothetical protein